MALFPMFLKLAGRLCLVVGARQVAKEKIRGLLLSDATVRVVAPEATPEIRALSRQGRIVWEQRAFVRGDLDGAFLAVAATSSRAVNDRVFREARRRGVLCNVVDDPERCDFYYPAVLQRGSLQIAVSTGGESPALAQLLRMQLEKQFGPEYEARVKKIGEARRALLASAKDPAERRRLSHALANRILARRKK